MKRTGLAWVQLIGLALVCSGVLAAQQIAVSPETLMGQARHLEEVEGNLDAAIAIYKKVIADPMASRARAATALLRMGLVYEKLGKPEARQAFEKIARDYSDQTDVATQARRRLAAIAIPGSAGETVFAERHIWSGPDLDAHLTANNAIGFRVKPSTDGQWLAFVDKASYGNVAIRNVATGEIRLITKDARRASKIGAQDAETAFHPVISPDGSQVAYQWASGGGYSIRVVPVGGGSPRVLLQRELYASAIAWAPDGNSLAIMAMHGADPHIALISLANRSSTRLTSLPWRENYRGTPPMDLGGFSPDGRFLLYSVPDELAPSKGGIFVIATDGSRETALVQGSSKNLSPRWTPDGRAVVFVSDRSTDYGLWSIRVENGKPAGAPELLRANVGPIQGLGFSRDGTYFYGSLSTQANIYVAGLDDSTLAITSAPTFLIDRFLGSNRGARWSPDGRFLAFVRSTNSGEHVVIRSADGAERTLSTTFRSGGYGFALPTWFPDSRSLLVPEVDRSTRRGTFRKVQIDTGADVVVLQGPNWEVRRVTGPSSDGRSLYYTKGQEFRGPDNTETVRLMRRDLDTGKETELYRHDVRGAVGAVAFFGLAISPDGSRLAFVGSNEGNPQTLMTVATSGLESPRVVARGGSVPGWADPDLTVLWTKDGRFILVSCYEGADQMRVWAFPSDGGEPRKVDLTMVADLKLTDLSADGRRLAFSSTTTKPVVVMVKNLLSSSTVK